MSSNICDCPKCGARYSVSYVIYGSASCDERRCDWTDAQRCNFPKEIKLSKEERISSLLDQIEKIRRE
jgi:hypothetical protein